jgi:hypothetical protein
MAGSISLEFTTKCTLLHAGGTLLIPGVAAWGLSRLAAPVRDRVDLAGDRRGRRR